MKISDFVDTLFDLYSALGWSIATAESCTGGKIAKNITDKAGSSSLFDAAFVTYSNEAKIQMLGVNPNLIEQHGAVSEEVALAMVKGALENSKADIAVSTTGIAGPGGSEFKPEGRVCFALCTYGCEPVTFTEEFGAIGRENVRKEATILALMLLIAAAQEEIKLRESHAQPA